MELWFPQHSRMPHTAGNESASGMVSSPEVMWRVVLTVSVLCWGSEGRTVCRDKNNDEVDWYILYNVPKLNKAGLSGLEYFYIDSAESEWLDPINGSEGVLANTLRPLLTHQTPTSDFGFISYNDQPPNKNASKACGHSKGVVMINKTTGVWLLHSTPKFPYNRTQGIFWPESGTRNAQIFICVTFAYSQLDKIGKHLLYIRAFPFDYNNTDSFPPLLRRVVNRENIKPNKTGIIPFLDQVLTSLAGQQFRSFAKNSSNSCNVEDLYPHIAKKLNSNLAAQTWRGKAEDKESDFPEEGTGDCMEEGRREDSLEEGRIGCSEQRRVVHTILEIELKKGRKVSWNNTVDHSKWCVTEDQNKPWICIADLNRAETQHKRPGGGFVY